MDQCRAHAGVSSERHVSPRQPLTHRVLPQSSTDDCSTCSSSVLLAYPAVNKSIINQSINHLVNQLIDLPIRSFSQVRRKETFLAHRISNELSTYLEPNDIESSVLATTFFTTLHQRLSLSRSSNNLLIPIHPSFHKTFSYYSYICLLLFSFILLSTM